MIRLVRRPRPQILVKKQEEWTQKFLDSGVPRPDHAKYRHQEIKEALIATSAGKCFYCEQAVPQRDGEVDHYREVGIPEHRALAYDWNNLYWSCRGCNDKIPESSIPCDHCLDPFDPAIDPEEHLVYDAEKILARSDSPRGRETIAKYKLAREELELARIRALRQLEGQILTLYREGYAFDSPEVGEILALFSTRDRPFSAMLRRQVTLLRR